MSPTNPKEYMREYMRKRRAKKKAEKLKKKAEEERKYIERTSRVIIKPTEKEKSSISSSEKPEYHATCKWCGVLMGLKEGLNELCNFCRQFDSKEEALAEKEWLKKMRKLRRVYTGKEIEKMTMEFRKAWKCSRCATVNPYYRKTCQSCGGNREGILIVKDNKLHGSYGL